VFGMNDAQEQVYSHVSALVQSAVDGFHVCILAYGQVTARRGNSVAVRTAETYRGLPRRPVQERRTR
jgi:kinesin family protein C1/nucleolar protein 58